MLWKCCTQYASKFGKQQWPQDWKRSVFIPISKKGNAKECSNYCTIVLISHASKVMLKILQARLQQYVNCELPDVQAGFRKGRRTRDQMPTSTGSWKKQESSRKTSISALLTMLNPLTMWITINCGKFWKRWAYQITWPASWQGQRWPQSPYPHTDAPFSGLCSLKLALWSQVVVRNIKPKTSLVVQWLQTCLLTQGIHVRSLV